MSKYAYAHKALLAQLRALTFVGAAIGDLSAKPATARRALMCWPAHGAAARQCFSKTGRTRISAATALQRRRNMSFVIRCKGPASNFELRSKLLNAEGEGRRSLGGAHLQRYGRASGTASPGKLNVQFSGSSQAVLS